MATLSTKIAEYFKDKSEIAAVYLFGSYAAGKQGLMSDVDLGIVVDEDRVDPDDLIALKERYLLDLSRIIRRDIHLVVLNRAGETLLCQILKKGQCILANNRQKEILFRTSALLKIVDFNYYKTMFQQRFIRSAIR